jgi:hypothetical protein
MGRLSKFWSIARREKQLLCEATILLLLSQLSVKVIPFKHIYRFLDDRWNAHPPSSLTGDNNIRLVDLSLSRARSLLPWKSSCLSRSISAFIMFRRRGIPAVMVAGVKFEESSLLAHAWIYSGNGNEMTDGKSENATYTALMRIGHEPVDC